MRAASGKIRELHLPMFRSAAELSRDSAKDVRLSQLRKLRECEQVAAVCYRKRRGGIEFLLVQTRGGNRWTFPKGSTEPGLTHAQAAALEAFEEAGVHGRIEEASFSRYVLRKRSTARKPGTRSVSAELSVNAHLCEVSRLSPPQESNRNRTWFSVQDARQCLREGRSAGDGAAFARVIEKAVRRIRRSYDGTATVGEPPNSNLQQDARLVTLQKDALQNVQLEACERLAQAASLTRYIHRPGNRQRSLAIASVQPRQVLQAEILQFGPMREKKPKVLGSGTVRSPTLVP